MLNILYHSSPYMSFTNALPLSLHFRRVNPLSTSWFQAVGSKKMVLLNSEMDQSDDDHSFELIDSDDLHTDKSDHTDNESFEYIGSDEMNSLKDMKEPNFAGNISEGNASGILDSEIADASKNDEEQLDNSDRYSHKSTDSQLSFPDENTYLGDASPVSELDDKHWRFKRRSFMYETTDISEAYELPPNIKHPRDMELKDIAKDRVLPFLPAKALVRFKAVCKEWDKWITHPFLAHLQSYCFEEMSGFFCQNEFKRFFVSLDKSAYGVPNSTLSFLPWNVEIRSSCKGLLLCQRVDQDGENEYYVCNPATGEFHVLPQSTYYHGPEPNLVLAFEPSPLNCGENYKVICAFDMHHGPPILCFDIYNSETRSWTCTELFCPELEVSNLKENGLYKDGLAYWATSGNLLALDIKNDIYQVQPICSDKEMLKAEGILTLVDGKISYIQSYVEPSYLESGTWCDDTDDMKYTCIIESFEFEGVAMCLKRRVTVDLNMKIYDTQSFRVLFAAKKDFCIFNIDNALYSCDVEKQKFEVIKRRGISSETRYIPYVNSLVSLCE